MSLDDELLKIIKSTDGLLTVSEISEKAGCPFTTISRHLAIMHAAGKLGLRKVGNAKLYKVLK